MTNLTEKLAALSEEERCLLLGNDTTDGLHYGFDHKRVVHAGVEGRPIMQPQAQQQAWEEHMQQPAEPGNRSVYVHIPFCERKCSYCGFFQNASREDIMHEYTELILREIQQTASFKRAQTGTINAVYLGGGTPSTLAGTDIARIVTAIRDYMPLANDCEITLEGRIHDMTEDRLVACQKAGINRFSLGVQSFNTKIRQAVGRIDPEEVVIERLQHLLGLDFATVVIDLMFGLPFQTQETWKHDLDMQFSLGLHGGDLYQLNVFPNSDLATHIEQGRVDPCMTTVEQASLYAWTVDYIKRTKPFVDLFDPSHWSQSRRERSIYNSLAKERADMFAFGSCAGGRVGNLQFMQCRDLKGYKEAMEAGRKPIMMMIDDGGHGRFNGDVKAQLENAYLDGRYFTRVWHRDVISYLEPLLDAWASKGLITCEDQVVRFTTAGLFWHDNLIQGILDCLNLEVAEERGLRQERVAHQDHPHAAGHPGGHPKGMGHPSGHPKGMGHPSGHPQSVSHLEGHTGTHKK